MSFVQQMYCLKKMSSPFQPKYVCEFVGFIYVYCGMELTSFTVHKENILLTGVISFLQHKPLDVRELSTMLDTSIGL